MASAGGNAAPIIIKRVVKKSGGGHHGGAWKVAYADFVTAMMAFFLLLWLLNATTEDQKQAISNYFAPASVSQTKSGAGGMFGGRTFSEGPMAYNGGAPGVAVMRPPPPEAGDEEDEDAESEGKPAVGEDEDRMGAGDAEAGTEKSGNEKAGSERSGVDRVDLRDREQLRKAAALEEKRQFEQAAAALRQAVLDAPDLKQFAASLVVDQTSEGLRIQIVDQERVDMFPRGSSTMHGHTRDLLQKVVTAIRPLPHALSVAGYTDSTPFANDKGYSNWELSSDRANASRRALIDLGLPANRITRVVGRADTDLLAPDQPTSPRNRRISITLMRKAPTPPPSG